MWPMINLLPKRSFKKNKDDCFRACLASITGLDYKDLPCLEKIYRQYSVFDWPDEYMPYVNTQLFILGYTLIQSNNLQGLYLACYQYSGIHHAVVGYNGMILFDPEPIKKINPPIKPYLTFKVEKNETTKTL